VHEGSHAPSYRELIGSHTRRVWSDAQGNALIEAFSIRGMKHGVPLGATREGCGTAGAFFLDVGISSTHHIARFWGLPKSLAEKSRVAALVSAPSAMPNDEGACVMLGARPESSHVSTEDTVAERDERQTQHALNPNDIIAAAFKAAGLPVPPKTSPGETPRVEPGPIIAAALKAAGLAQN